MKKPTIAARPAKQVIKRKEINRMNYKSKFKIDGNESKQTIEKLCLREVESLNPCPPRDDGSVKNYRFIIAG